MAIIVNKGNVHSIEHDRVSTLTVEFMGNGLKYTYKPFSQDDFDQLVIAAGDDDKEVFKKHFKEKVKDNSRLTYKKL